MSSPFVFALTPIYVAVLKDDRYLTHLSFKKDDRSVVEVTRYDLSLLKGLTIEDINDEIRTFDLTAVEISPSEIIDACYGKVGPVAFTGPFLSPQGAIMTSEIKLIKHETCVSFEKDGVVLAGLPWKNNKKDSVFRAHVEHESFIKKVIPDYEELLLKNGIRIVDTDKTVCDQPKESPNVPFGCTVHTGEHSAFLSDQWGCPTYLSSIPDGTPLYQKYLLLQEMSSDISKKKFELGILIDELGFNGFRVNQEIAKVLADPLYTVSRTVHQLNEQMRLGKLNDETMALLKQLESAMEASANEEPSVSE